MAKDLILVTGATGFVGSHVARLLLERGGRIRILARNSSVKDNIEGLACEVAIGDLKDPASLQRSLHGCRMVYHVAADYRLWARNVQEIYDNNVGGTRNLLSACREARIEKVVYTSTVGTIGMRRDGVPADEESPVSLDHMIGHYKRSKFMAERIALDFAASGLPVVIVNPTTPVGTLDVKPTPTGKVILDFLRGRMPGYLDTGLNVVNVRDVARGHLLAAEKGRVGQRYILGGENWTLQQILAALARMTGRPMPRIRVPWILAYLAGGISGFVEGSVLHKEPGIPLEGVRMSRYKMFVTSDKARRELGYSPGPAEDALHEAVLYFRSRQDHSMKVCNPAYGC
jgi:dihydroflavonol-4-reductase